jgi:hypothetical protein
MFCTVNSGKSLFTSRHGNLPPVECGFMWRQYCNTAGGMRTEFS